MRSGLYIEVSRSDRACNEDDRRHVAAVLASGLVANSRPSSSTHQPVDDSPIDLEGVILNRSGSVRVMTSSEVGQGRVARALTNLGPDYTREAGRETRLRRYVIGLTGYMAAMSMADIVSLLEMQNPNLPRGGITPVSLFPGKGERPRPVLFADLSEETVKYLTKVGMSLRTFSSKVGVRPLKESDGQ